MVYRQLADVVLVVHGLFVLFVVFGGLLAMRWPRMLWVHPPVALYGVLIEFVGWVCPLTPLENHLRRLGGEAGYPGGFIEHYLLPTLYPSGLSRGVQWALGGAALLVNIVIYAFVLRRRRMRSSS